MRRLVPGLLLALCAAAGAVPAAAVPAEPSAPSSAPVLAVRTPVLAARLVDCATGADARDRSATFAASMPLVDGAVRIALRFDLRQQLPSSALPTVVPVPGWGVWQSADPGRPGLVATRRVVALAAPARYSALVRFRWYGRGGRLLRETRRTTPACVQPWPGPHLALGALTATPAGPTTASYAVVVRNDGLAPTLPGTVLLRVGSAPPAAAMVVGLEPDAVATVSVPGPRCVLGEVVTVTLDGRAPITRPCPA